VQGRARREKDTSGTNNNDTNARRDRQEDGGTPPVNLLQIKAYH
jgi:hypothetical protein